MSILVPTASRILRTGPSPRSISAGVMCCPPFASAISSNGQIFIAVMPCVSRSVASASASVRKSKRWS